ncbi:NitT/TauT family transport system substrate-binding protein [Lipingzhangella halophila]|uniref:NitT/TauT family transport system substrate-binding protein n=1 Tax=Lipingzhangella halophila TaxID=1783352 RepID=A0A7W7RG02_9ACTN|nr:ABC transporter substrate-binding protein [Lipingzhangella halophila]MBB4931222.1 NitT/TauT family transport system substrate-binding protein [Lipingzhangella halophila]
MRELVRPTTAIVAATALAATACGGGSGDADGGERVTINIGTLPIANAAPMYMGMEEGFFEEEGLEVEPTVLQGGNEIVTGLVSGDYDFGFVGYISAGVAVSQGLPVCVVTANDATGTSEEDDWQVLVADSDAGIDGPEDLDGATIGVNALGGNAEVLIKAALDQEGLDPNSVELIEVPFPEVPGALSEGRIDAGYTSEPFITTVLDEGGEVAWAPQAALAPEYPNGNYTTGEQYMQENADVVERFTRAMDRSVEYARDNEDAVRASIPEFTEIPEEMAERMRLPVFTSEIDEPAVQEQMEFTAEYDVTDSAPSTDELLCQ